MEPSHLRRDRIALRRLVVLGTAVVTALALGNCGGNSAGADAAVGEAGAGLSTEIYSWWLLGGEAQALQQVFQAYTTAHPTVRLVNTAAQNNSVGYNARAELAARMAAKTPPDAFQETGTLPTWVTTGNGIVPLDDFFAAEGWGSHVYSFLDQATLVDGVRYAIPTDIGSQNVIWYNKRVFSVNGLAPPKDWDEFVAVAEALKANGIAPLGMTLQGWVMRIVFDALILDAAPDPARRGQFLLDVYAGKASDGISVEALALKKAIAHFDTLVTNFVNSDWATTDASGNTVGWDALTDRVASGKVAMFLHGDWTKGYLDNAGETGGVDYDASFFPDGAASNSYLYNVDTFCLPVGANNPQGGKDFIRTFLAPSTQAAFAKKKGSCPVRKDVDLSQLDGVAQAICSSIASKTYAISVSEGFDSILQNAYSQGVDGGALSNVQDVVYRQIAAYYPPQ